MQSDDPTHRTGARTPEITSVVVLLVVVGLLAYAIS